MRMTQGVMLIVGVCLMAACSSSQDASTGNRAWPDGGLGVDSRQFPVTVELDTHDRKNAQARNEERTRAFEALVAVDLLQVEATTVESQWSLGRNKREVPGATAAPARRCCTA